MCLRIASAIQNFYFKLYMYNTLLNPPNKIKSCGKFKTSPHAHMQQYFQIFFGLGCILATTFEQTQLTLSNSINYDNS